MKNVDCRSEVCKVSCAMLGAMVKFRVRSEVEARQGSAIGLFAFSLQSVSGLQLRFCFRFVFVVVGAMLRDLRSRREFEFGKGGWISLLLSR